MVRISGEKKIGELHAQIGDGLGPCVYARTSDSWLRQANSENLFVISNVRSQSQAGHWTVKSPVS